MANNKPERPKEILDRQIIVRDIQAIKVEPGKPLRQVQVSDETYAKAKKFVLTSPIMNNGKFHRFKILVRLPSGRSIYDLLIADAGSTTLQEADQKITEWRDASKSLVRYALNLLLAPKRPEFQRLKVWLLSFVTSIIPNIETVTCLFNQCVYFLYSYQALTMFIKWPRS